MGYVSIRKVSEGCYSARVNWSDGRVTVKEQNATSLRGAFMKFANDSPRLTWFSIYEFQQTEHQPKEIVGWFKEYE